MNKTKPQNHYKNNEYTRKILRDYRINQFNHMKRIKKNVKHTRKLRQSGGVWPFYNLKKRTNPNVINHNLVEEVDNTNFDHKKYNKFNLSFLINELNKELKYKKISNRKDLKKYFAAISNYDKNPNQENLKIAINSIQTIKKIIEAERKRGREREREGEREREEERERESNI